MCVSVLGGFTLCVILLIFAVCLLHLVKVLQAASKLLPLTRNVCASVNIKQKQVSSCKHKEKKGNSCGSGCDTLFLDMLLLAVVHFSLHCSWLCDSEIIPCYNILYSDLLASQRQNTQANRQMYSQN